MPSASSLSTTATNNLGHFGNGLASGSAAAPQAPQAPTAAPAVNKKGQNLPNDIMQTSPSSQEGPKTKAMLKGWSTLAQTSNQATPVSSNKGSRIKATDTFIAFKKAAQEKQERERQLQEQQLQEKMKKEEAERQRKQQETEKRRALEEEEALEQARRAMMLKDVTRPSGPMSTAANHNSSSFSSTQATIPAPASQATQAATAPIAAQAAVTANVPQATSLESGHDEIDAAEKARIERERQRQREQERRRREAKANQIDMNLQSNILAEFEDTII